MLLVLGMLALPAVAAETEAGKVVTFDVASGGVLGSVATALIMWLNSQRKARMQVSPDPLNVKGVPPSVKSPTCEATHKGVDEHLRKNQTDHDDIFPRLAKVEQRVAVLEGTIEQIRIEYKSIDDKLTILLRRK